MRYASLKKIDDALDRQAHLFRAHGGSGVDVEALELTSYFLQVLGDVAWAAYQIENAECDSSIIFGEQQHERAQPNS